MKKLDALPRARQMLLSLFILLFVVFQNSANAGGLATSAPPTVLPPPGGGASNEQIFPPTLPNSMEEAWMFALSQIRQATFGFYGPSIAENSHNGNFANLMYENGVEPSQLQRDMRSTLLKFDIVDDAELYGFANLSMKDGFVLFSAADKASVQRFPQRSVVRLPELKLRISDMLRVPYTGAAGGSFRKKDRAGNVIVDVALAASQNYLYIPVGLYGDIDTFMKTGNDESTPGVINEISVRVYDADGLHEDTYRNGLFITPQSVQGTVSAMFSFLEDLGTDPVRVKVSVPEEQPQFIIHFKTTSALQLPVYASQGTIRTQGGIDKVVTEAREGALYDSENNKLQEFVVPQNGVYMLIVPEQGTYTIILDKWDDPTFGANYREYHPFDTGGGQGGGTAGGGGGE